VKLILRASLPGLVESVPIAAEPCKSRRQVLKYQLQDNDPFHKIEREDSVWFLLNPELTSYSGTMFNRFECLMQIICWHFAKRVILTGRTRLEKKGFFLRIFLDML
jgi:hypothetical protein